MKAIIFWTIAVLLVFVSRFDRIDWMSALMGAALMSLAGGWAAKLLVRRLSNEGRRRVAARRES